jgi:hypothetical protein
MIRNWFGKLLFHVNRNHKDRLFCTIFGSEKNKKYALSLYNAVNGSDYAEESDLEIVTLEDAIYVKMKNDVAYLFYGNMALYEHQSSVNPNMPLRGLMYFGDLYNKYISLGNHDIFGKKLVKIPTPQYVVFYNGTDPLPEKSLLKLSSAFINPREDGQFEWTATVYNINYGHNQKLLDACVPLKGYSILISKYRAYSNHLSPENAMRKAVDECINNNILTDVLKEQRTSAMLEALTTYNKKAYEEGIREEGREEGREEMREEMRRFYADELSAKDHEIAMLKAELERLTRRK